MYRNGIETFIDNHKEEMLEDIKTLCRINSERTSYREGMPFGEGAFHALETALGIASGYGFEIRNYENFVGTVDLNGLEPQLDILAHLDVVPAGDGWKVTGPFEPVVVDGKLYGRGTADDKGPAVAALYAMRAIRELRIPMKKNVRLILGTDEECGGEDIEHYYSVEKEAPMTFSPDASFPVINIEKGSLQGHFTGEYEICELLPRVISLEAGTKANVVPGTANAVIEGLEPSVLSKTVEKLEKDTGIHFAINWENSDRAEISAVGQGAHASTPEEGKNALTGLLELLDSLPLAPGRQKELIHGLAVLFPHGDLEGKSLGVAMEDEISGKLTLAFSLLSMNLTGLEGTFDSRCPICSNEENVLLVARKRMAEFGLTLHNEEMRPPHHVAAESVFVETLLKNYQEYTGEKGSCIAIGGGTYVHDLKNGVAFGASMPGTDTHIHGADEFAVVDELLLSAKIFASVIVDLCSE